MEARDIYVVKVYLVTNGDKALQNILHYAHLENIVADVHDRDSLIYEDIPEAWMPDDPHEVYLCHASTEMRDGTEIADDFEFRYREPIGTLVIYVGRIDLVDLAK